MKTNETLGDVIDEGDKLHATCSKCGKNYYLDLEMLVKKLDRGRGFVWLYGNLAAKLKCKDCNTKTIEVRFHPKLKGD